MKIYSEEKFSIRFILKLININKNQEKSPASATSKNAKIKGTIRKVIRGISPDMFNSKWKGKMDIIIMDDDKVFVSLESEQDMTKVIGKEMFFITNFSSKYNWINLPLNKKSRTYVDNKDLGK